MSDDGLEFISDPHLDERCQFVASRFEFTAEPVYRSASAAVPQITRHPTSRRRVVVIPDRYPECQVEAALALVLAEPANPVRFAALPRRTQGIVAGGFSGALTGAALALTVDNGTLRAALAVPAVMALIAALAALVVLKYRRVRWYSKTDRGIAAVYQNVDVAAVLTERGGRQPSWFAPRGFEFGSARAASIMEVMPSAA